MKGINMKNITIGIPRSLFYYKYKYLWTTFFRELKVNILLSPHTNEHLINKGKKILKNRLCIPLQIYVGHVHYLIDKTDYILIPTTSNKICYISLYDIINNSLNCNILNIDMRKDEEDSFLELGLKLGFNKQTILNAYKEAKKEEYKQRKINYLLQQKRLEKEGKKVLIMGDDYIENDKYILNQIIKNDEYQFFYSNIINPDIKSYKNALFSNIKNLKGVMDRAIYISTKPCFFKNEIIDDKNIEKIIFELQKEEINNG